jgi:nucleotide-binding universal stress UspA family protein
MKVKPARLRDSVVMEMNDDDAGQLSKPAGPRFKLRKILVPVDFSACSEKAVHYAVPLAEQFNAEILFLYVLPVPVFGREYDFVNDAQLIEEDLHEDAERKLKSLVAELVPAEIRVRIEVLYGAEALGIVRAATKWETDLIVISTRGRTGRVRALVGSVAERVVELAPCPVLVVREHEREFIHRPGGNLFARPVL